MATAITLFIDICAIGKPGNGKYSKTMLTTGLGGQVIKETSEDIYSFGRKAFKPLESIETVGKDNLTGIEKGLLELTQKEEFEEKLLPCIDSSCQKDRNPVGNGKTLKKLFILMPPPVLVLQINRFQQKFRGLIKLNDEVSYPMVLNFTPFCSLATQAVYPGISEVMYSLYGIVAHSGSLNGGHYVAYVKTNGRSSEAFLQELITEIWDDPEKITDKILEYLQNNSPVVVRSKLGDPLEGSKMKHNWYYISDSYCQPCAENQILDNRNAYILFYERTR